MSSASYASGASVWSEPNDRAARSTASEALLQIDDLSVALPSGSDRQHALRQVTLDLHHGEVLCVVGESGSGKSMLANAVIGLLPPEAAITHGRIALRDNDLLALSPRARRATRGRDIGMIFQEPLSALNPLMTIGAQIEEVMLTHPARQYGTHQDATRSRNYRRARVLELIGLVGLPDAEALERAYPATLSGGQRQRVLIAIALALDPALLIADEPTTALDVTTQAKILALIARIQRKTHMGVLFVTHDIGIVSDIADRVAVLQQGVMVECGEAQQVLNAPRHAYTQALLASFAQGRPSAVDGAGRMLHVGGDGGAEPAAARDRRSPILDAQDLRRHYAARRLSLLPTRSDRRSSPPALDGVSVQVAEGETLGIVGESGSGKSTLARTLMRLNAPHPNDSGRILLAGQDISAWSAARLRPIRHTIQMIFQDPFASLNPRKTVGSIIASGPIARGLSAAAAHSLAYRWLERVGLPRSAFARYPHQFSGGQRQRISIARALALEPRVLIADEAVSGLDASVQTQILSLLDDIQRALGLALIFITHDLHVAARISDRVAVMQHGRIVETGASVSVFQHPQHPYTRLLIDSAPGKRQFQHLQQQAQAPAPPTRQTPSYAPYEHTRDTLGAAPSHALVATPIGQKGQKK